MREGRSSNLPARLRRHRTGPEPGTGPIPAAYEAANFSSLIASKSVTSPPTRLVA